MIEISDEYLFVFTDSKEEKEKVKKVFDDYEIPFSDKNEKHIITYRSFASEVYNILEENLPENCDWL